MSFERQVKRRLDELRESGESEFRAGETLEEWIRRMVAELPDPWAGVQKFHEEVKARSRERKLQKWVDEHRVK